MAELQILKTGLPLIYIHRNQKIGHIVIHFNRGSSSDPEKLQGAVHLLEHMLFKGTTTRNYFDLICGIEHFGADLNAFTTKENMIIHVSYPDQYMDDICLILSDIVNNSIFDEKELKKEKQVVCDEIKSYRDTPEEFIYDEWERLMLSGNGLSHPILGSAASVNRISLDDLKKTYKSIRSDYQISVVSSRTKDHVKKIISKHFKTKVKSTRSVNLTKIIREEKPKIKILNDDVSQAHVILGRIGPHYTHDDQLPAYLLSSFLGGSAMSSVLNLELREKRGISYTIESSLQSYRDKGLFFTYFTCDKQRTGKALQVIAAIFENYRINGLSKKEFETLIRMTKSQYTMFFEPALNEAMYHSKFYQYYNQIAQIPDLMRELGKIKLEAVNTVAAKLLDFEKFSRIIIEKK